LKETYGSWFYLNASFTCSMSSHVRTPNIHGTPANSQEKASSVFHWEVGSLSTKMERAAVN